MIPTCHPDRKHKARGMCPLCYDQWLYKVNPDAKAKMRARNRAYYLKHYHKRERCYSREATRKYCLKRLYGLTPEDVERMICDQNSQCAICKKTSNDLNVDHDHKTGKVRGMLCGGCNALLGRWENPQTHIAIKEYLNAV